MPFEAGSIISRLLLDTSDFEKGKKRVNTDVGEMIEKFGKLAGKIAAIWGAIELPKSFAEAADEEAQILAKLQKNIENTGEVWENVADKVATAQDYMLANSKLTGDQVLTGLNRLVIYNGNLDNAIYGVSLASKIASSGLTTYENAVAAVGFAMEGSIEKLSRMLPELRITNQEQLNNADSATKAAYAIDLLQEKFGDQPARKIATYGGALRQYKNYINEIRSEIGESLLPVFETYYSYLGRFAKVILDFIKSHKEATAAIVLTVTALLSLGAAITSLTLLIPLITTGLTTITALMTPQIAAVLLLVGSLYVLRAVINETFESSAGAMDGFRNRISADADAIQAKIDELISGSGKTTDDFWEDLKVGAKAVANFFLMLIGGVLTFLVTAAANTLNFMDSMYNRIGELLIETAKLLDPTLIVDYSAWSAQVDKVKAMAKKAFTDSVAEYKGILIDTYDQSEKAFKTDYIDKITQYLGMIPEKATEIATAANDVVQSAWSSTKKQFKKDVDDVVDYLSKAAPKVTDAFKGMKFEPDLAQEGFGKVGGTGDDKGPVTFQSVMAKEGIKTSEILQLEYDKLNQLLVLAQYKKDPIAISQLQSKIDDLRRSMDPLTAAGIENANSLQIQYDALKRLLDLATEAKDPIAIRNIKEQLDELKRSMDTSDPRSAEGFFSGIRNGIQDTIKEFGDLKTQGQSAIRSLAGDFSTGLTDSIIEFAQNTDKGGEIFEKFIGDMILNMAKMILQIGINYAISAALQAAFGGVTAATAAATATAWAPAAAFVSLATFGANAAAAMAGIGATLGFSLGSATIAASAAPVAGGAATGAGALPGFADGIQSVPYDGVFRLHKGEQLVPRYDAMENRYGGKSGGGRGIELTINNYLDSETIVAAGVSTPNGGRSIDNHINESTLRNGSVKKTLAQA